MAWSKSKDKNKHLRGMNIYLDDKGRDVYYDRLFTKCGYIIAEKNKGTYGLYANRFIIPVISAVLALTFYVSELYSFLIGLGIYIMLEGLFRLKFLPSLTKLSKFKPTQKLTYIEQLQTQDTKKMIALVFLLIAFSVLLVLNAVVEEYTGLTLYLSYVAAAAGIIYAILYFVAVIKKK